MVIPSGCNLASPAVVLDGVRPTLLAVLSRIGLAHQALFGSACVITSGMDSEHVAGSLHGEGRAVDVRVNDLSEPFQSLWVFIVCTLAKVSGCSVFDERGLMVPGHLHIEYRG